MILPASARGWEVPTTKSSPDPLTVVRRGGPWGWLYQSGTMNADMTNIDPRRAQVWIENSEWPLQGLTFLNYEAPGRWDETFRAAAAMLHFCIEDTELDRSDPNIKLTVPRLTLDKMTKGSDIYLRNLGFSGVYDGDPLTASAGHVHACARTQFPEFAGAVALPREQF